MSKSLSNSDKIIELALKKCVPCKGGVPPLESARVNDLIRQVNHAWFIVPAVEKNAMRICREFKFKNFIDSMRFVNRVAAIAESENHHPDLHIRYNKVLIELWTHAVGGLSENDFILAAKIDELI